MSEASLPNVLAQRFQVSDRIAAGQAGPTYRVLETSTQRVGALKVIEAARGWTAAERGRLGRELEKLATLKHPYLAEVYATGIADDLPWVFRAEIEGESLRQKIEASRASGQPYAHALHVIAQLSAALDEVHRAGLLQRDLSPEHVIVRPDGTVGLIDTGVAMRIASASVFEIAGKPAYVSPEHATGKLVSFRSDLYALGCMLYEMLAGVPPFVGTPDQVLEQHRQKPAPALEGQPQPVTALVAQLLQKDPRDRPFSAQQVRRTLEPLTGALGVPQSKPQGGGTLLGLAAVSAPQGHKPRADATEQLSALDLAKHAIAPPTPGPRPVPRADGTEQLSALDLARAEALVASNASPDGPAMTQQRQSVPPPPPGQKRSVPPPPPPPRTSVPGQMSAPPSGGLAVPPPPPPSGQVAIPAAAAAPPPSGQAPANPSSQELDYDDFAETKAVSRDMVNELRALGGLDQIEPGLAPTQAMPAAATPAPAQQGFGAPAPAQQGFGAPATQQGFGAPAPAQQGFGAPAQQGFGAPAQQGFGAPAQQGFGAAAPAQQGFGAPAPAQQGFGAPAAQQGFGAPAPAQQGFGAPAPAQQGFGAPAASSAGGFGAPAASSAGGFGAPAASSAGGFGAPAASSAGGFGAPAASSAGGFGAPSSSAGGFPAAAPAYSSAPVAEPKKSRTGLWVFLGLVSFCGFSSVASAAAVWFLDVGGVQTMVLGAASGAPLVPVPTTPVVIAPPPTTTAAPPVVPTMPTAPAVVMYHATVDSNPPGAAITINGTPRGPAPVTVEVARDTMVQASATLDGYYDSSMSMQAVSDLTMTITLQPRATAAVATTTPSTGGGSTPVIGTTGGSSSSSTGSSSSSSTGSSSSRTGSSSGSSGLSSASSGSSGSSSGSSGSSTGLASGMRPTTSGTSTSGTSTSGTSTSGSSTSGSSSGGTGLASSMRPGSGGTTTSGTTTSGTTTSGTTTGTGAPRLATGLRPGSGGTGSAATTGGSTGGTTSAGGASSGATVDELRAQARAHFQARRYREAAQAYEQATRLAPTNASIWSGLGTARLQGGDNAGAVQAYERAVQLAPTNAGIRVGLGRAYARSGNRDAARRELERALQLDPNNADARTGLAQL
jgi:serine/threonine protein kinase